MNTAVDGEHEADRHAKGSDPHMFSCNQLSTWTVITLLFTKLQCDDLDMDTF